MLNFIKSSANRFAGGRAGRRFVGRYNTAQLRGHGLLRRGLMVGVGLVVFALGVFFIPAPGPGLLIMLAGATLVAQESRAVAVKLDRGEVHLRKGFGRLRRWWKRKATPAKKMAVAAGAMCILGGMAIGAIEVFQA
ncbi:MAG: hypothetical protein EOO28_31410 [Comamonadaceae bacterium]|nr:MAG: hypothetical protein EOO28_31410 [Comamonadaceae bacterium]